MTDIALRMIDGAFDLAVEHGDLAAEIQMAAAAGIDGLFSDFTDLACEALARSSVTKP